MDARFGKYLLHERIGVGGMAEVFRATLPGVGGIDKDCVLKRMLPTLAETPEALEMFLEEARISISLQHGNIVPVFDFGAVDGTYYLAMEHVSGKNLGAILHRLRKTALPFPIALAVHVVIELCRGLGYAHGRSGPEGRPLGLVHRDISPGNILVSLDGDVRIVDFGIAKVQERSIHTDAFTLKGKIPYMSPEQARGERVDARTDLYAAGVVLFEMIAGRRPFEGENQIQTLELVRAGGAPRLGAFRPQVPPPLEELVARALAAHPLERFQDARAMQVALTRFAARHDATVTSSDLAMLVQGLFPELGSSSTSPSGAMAPSGPSGAAPALRTRTDPFERALLGAVGAPSTGTRPPPELHGPDLEPTVPDARQAPEPVVTNFQGVVVPALPPARPARGRAVVIGTALAVLAAVAVGLGVWGPLREAPPAQSGPLSPGERVGVRVVAGAAPQAVPSAAAQAPRQGGAVAPGQDSAAVPGQDSVAVPGQDSAAVPGQDSAAVPEGRAARQDRAPDSAPDRASTGTGTLVVNCVPWAQVWLDGRRRAESTPATLRALAGTHVLRLVNPEQHLTRSMQVQVRAGRTVRVVSSLR